MATEASRNKAKFRQSKKWKCFRKDLAAYYDKLDALTNKSLRPAYSAHHLCLKEDEYENISFERLVPLNKTSHRVIHYLWQYYKDDKSILDRLKDIMQRMEDLND